MMATEQAPVTFAVYALSSGSWSQLGGDIDGEAANDLSGYSVSMNAAGDRVAIGAYQNDGTASTRVTYASTNTPPVLGLSLEADIDGEAANDFWKIRLHELGR